MWEPRRLTILWASMICYRDSFTFNTCDKNINICEISNRLQSRPFVTDADNEISEQM
jgi:hypothetical protein